MRSTYLGGAGSLGSAYWPSPAENRRLARGSDATRHRPYRCGKYIENGKSLVLPTFFSQKK